MRKRKRQGPRSAMIAETPEYKLAIEGAFRKPAQEPDDSQFPAVTVTVSDISDLVREFSRVYKLDLDKKI